MVRGGGREGGVREGKGGEREEGGEVTVHRLYKTLDKRHLE